MILNISNVETAFSLKEVFRPLYPTFFVSSSAVKANVAYCIYIHFERIFKRLKREVDKNGFTPYKMKQLQQLEE